MQRAPRNQHRIIVQADEHGRLERGALELGRGHVAESVGEHRERGKRLWQHGWQHGMERPNGTRRVCHLASHVALDGTAQRRRQTIATPVLCGVALSTVLMARLAGQLGLTPHCPGDLTHLREQRCLPDRRSEVVNALSLFYYPPGPEPAGGREAEDEACFSQSGASGGAWDVASISARLQWGTRATTGIPVPATIAQTCALAAA